MKLEEGTGRFERHLQASGCSQRTIRASCFDPEGSVRFCRERCLNLKDVAACEASVKGSQKTEEQSRREIASVSDPAVGKSGSLCYEARCGRQESQVSRDGDTVTPEVEVDYPGGIVLFCCEAGPATNLRPGGLGMT